MGVQRGADTISTHGRRWRPYLAGLGDCNGSEASDQFLRLAIARTGSKPRLVRPFTNWGGARRVDRDTIAPKPGWDADKDCTPASGNQPRGFRQELTSGASQATAYAG